jgi:hypothetical protein
MKAEEAVNKIKELLKMKSEQVEKPVEFEKEVEKVEVKFEDVTLKDGTILIIDAMEVGASVKIGNTSAPTGDYVTEDDKIIKVDSGKIVEIIEPIVEPEIEVEMIDKKYDELTAANEKLSSQVAEYESKHIELQSVLAKLEAEIEKLKVTPAVKVEDILTQKSEDKKEDLYERLSYWKNNK